MGSILHPEMFCHLFLMVWAVRLLNFRQGYGAYSHFRQVYASRSEPKVARAVEWNQYVTMTQAAILWVQNGNIIGFVKDMELRLAIQPSSMSRRLGSTTMKDQSKRPTVTFEQLSYSNMLMLNALVELLA